MKVTDALEGLIALQLARAPLDEVFRAQLGFTPMLVRDHRGRDWRRFDYRDETADTILGEIEEDHDGQWVFACYPDIERTLDGLVFFVSDDFVANVFDSAREQTRRNAA
jgi:hypothetical protein